MGDDAINNDDIGSAAPPFVSDDTPGSGVFPNSNKFKTPANQIKKAIESDPTVHAPALKTLAPHTHPALKAVTDKYAPFAKTYFKPEYQDALKSFMGNDTYNKMLYHMPQEHYDALTTHVQLAAPNSNKFTVPFNSLKKKLDSGSEVNVQAWMDKHPQAVKTYMSSPKYQNAIKNHLGPQAYKRLVDNLTPDQKFNFTGQNPSVDQADIDAIKNDDVYTEPETSHVDSPPLPEPSHTPDNIKDVPADDDISAIKHDSDGLEINDIKDQQALLDVNQQIHKMFPDSKWDDNQTPEQASRTLDFLINNLDKEDYSPDEINSLQEMSNKIKGITPNNQSSDSDQSSSEQLKYPGKMSLELMHELYPNSSDEDAKWLLSNWNYSYPTPQKLQSKINKQKSYKSKKFFQNAYDKIYGPTMSDDQAKSLADSWNSSFSTPEKLEKALDDPSLPRDLKDKYQKVYAMSFGSDPHQEPPPNKFTPELFKKLYPAITSEEAKKQAQDWNEEFPTAEKLQEEIDKFSSDPGFRHYKTLLLKMYNKVFGPKYAPGKVTPEIIKKVFPNVADIDTAVPTPSNQSSESSSSQLPQYPGKYTPEMFKELYPLLSDSSLQYQAQYWNKNYGTPEKLQNLIDDADPTYKNYYQNLYDKAFGPQSQKSSQQPQHPGKFTSEMMKEVFPDWSDRMAQDQAQYWNELYSTPEKLQKIIDDETNPSLKEQYQKVYDLAFGPKSQSSTSQYPGKFTPEMIKEVFPGWWSDRKEQYQAQSWNELYSTPEKLQKIIDDETNPSLKEKYQKMYDLAFGPKSQSSSEKSQYPGKYTPEMAKEIYPLLSDSGSQDQAQYWNKNYGTPEKLQKLIDKQEDPSLKEKYQKLYDKVFGPKSQSSTPPPQYPGKFTPEIMKVLNPDWSDKKLQGQAQYWNKNFGTPEKLQKLIDDETFLKYKEQYQKLYDLVFGPQQPQYPGKYTPEIMKELNPDWSDSFAKAQAQYWNEKYPTPEKLQKKIDDEPEPNHKKFYQKLYDKVFGPQPLSTIKAPILPPKSQELDPEEFMHYMENKPSTMSQWNSMAQWWAATKISPEAEAKLYSSWFPNKPTPTPQQANSWFKAVFEQFSDPSEDDLQSPVPPVWASSGWALGDKADKEWPVFQKWATTDPDLPNMSLSQKLGIWKHDLSDKQKAKIEEDYSPSAVKPLAVIKELKKAFPDSNFSQWKSLTPGEVKTSLADMVKGGFTQAADIYNHFYDDKITPPAKDQMDEDASSPQLLDPSTLPDYVKASKNGNILALHKWVNFSKVAQSLGIDLPLSKADISVEQKSEMNSLDNTLNDLSPAQKSFIKKTPVSQLPWTNKSEFEDWAKSDMPSPTKELLKEMGLSSGSIYPSNIPSYINSFIAHASTPEQKQKLLSTYHDEFESDKPTLVDYLQDVVPSKDWKKLLQGQDAAGALKVIKYYIKKASTPKEYAAYANALSQYFPHPNKPYDVAPSGDKYLTSVLKSAYPGKTLYPWKLKNIASDWGKSHNLALPPNTDDDLDKLHTTYSSPFAYVPYAGYTTSEGGASSKIDPSMYASHIQKNYKVPDDNDLDTGNNALLKELVNNAHVDRDVTWNPSKFSDKMTTIMAPDIARMNPKEQVSFANFLSHATPSQAKVWVGDILDHASEYGLDASQEDDLKGLYEKYFLGSGYSDKDKEILSSPAFRRFFNSAPVDYQESMALSPGSAIDDFKSVFEGTLNPYSPTLPRSTPTIFRGTQYPYTNEDDKFTVKDGPYKGAYAYKVHTGPNTTFDYIPQQVLSDSPKNFKIDQSRDETMWPGLSYNPQRGDQNRRDLVKHEIQPDAPGQLEIPLPPGQQWAKPEKPYKLQRGVGLPILDELKKLRENPPTPPPPLPPPDEMEQLRQTDPTEYTSMVNRHRTMERQYGIQLEQGTLLRQIDYLLGGQMFKDRPNLFNSAGKESEHFVPVPHEWEKHPPSGPQGVLEFNKWVNDNNVPPEQTYDLAKKWEVNNPENYGIPGLSDGPWTEPTDHMKSKSTELSQLLARYISATDFLSSLGYAPPGSYGDHWTANLRSNSAAQSFADRGNVQVVTRGNFSGKGENPDTAHVTLGFGSSIGNGENEINYSPGAPFDMTHMFVRAPEYGINDYTSLPVQRGQTYYA